MQEDFPSYVRKDFSLSLYLSRCLSLSLSPSLSLSLSLSPSLSIYTHIYIYISLSLSLFLSPSLSIYLSISLSLSLLYFFISLALVASGIKQSSSSLFCALINPTPEACGYCLSRAAHPFHYNSNVYESHSLIEADIGFCASACLHYKFKKTTCHLRRTIERIRAQNPTAAACCSYIHGVGDESTSQCALKTIHARVYATEQ